MNSKDIPFVLSFFIWIISLIAIIYSLFAGLWGFNPTNIDWFNTKLLGTSIIICCISTISTKITARFT